MNPAAISAYRALPGSPVGARSHWETETAGAIASLSTGARINLGGMVVERVSGFALILVLAALLPPAALGGFYEVSAICAVLTTVALLGMDVGVVRATAAAAVGGRDADVRRTRALALGVSGTCSVVVVLVLWFLAPAIADRMGAPSLTAALRAALPAIPLVAAAWILVAPARGLRLMLPGALALQVAQPVAQLTVTALLLRHAATAGAAAMGLTASAAAGCAVAFGLGWHLRRSNRGDAESAIDGPTQATPRRRLARSLVGFAIPVAGMALIDSGLLWVDAIILGLYRPAGQVATYGLIARFMTLSLATMVAISTIFGPLVTRHVEQHDVDGLQVTLRAATRWAALIGAPILASVSIFGVLVIRLLHQPTTGAGAALVVLAAGFLVDVCTGPVGNVLTMSGKSALNLANTAVGLAANIALNLVLVPRFGILGAAISWAAVIVCINAARVLQVRRLFGVSPFGPGLWKPLVAAAAAASLTFAVLHAGIERGVLGAGSAHVAGFSGLIPILVGLVLLAVTHVVVFITLRPDPNDVSFLRNLVRWPGSLPYGRVMPGFDGLTNRMSGGGGVALWAALIAIAFVVGSGIGIESKVGMAAGVGLAALIVTFVVPIQWLAYASVAACMLFRVLAPTSAGVASYLPDVLIGAIVVRAAVDRAVWHGASNRLRRLTIPLALFGLVALLSWLDHGGGLRVLVASLRQFVRFPLWAVALAASALTWEHAKRMMWLVLSISLIQLPFALHQLATPYDTAALLPGVHFYRGDSITGTFGLAGSNSAMIFLVICALIWIGLVLHRVVPAWILWFVAPAIVIPMALGSAAAFAVLLPVPVMILLFRAAMARGSRVTWGALAAGLAIVALVIVSAGSLAKAPGIDSSSQTSATSVFSSSYLSQYVDRTTQAGPTTRLGFLTFSLRSTAFDGPQHALVGVGLGDSVIGTNGVQIGPTSDSVLATASIQSVPRVILGFGLLGLIAYMLLLVASAVPPRLRTADPTANALALVLPVAGAVYMLAGIYNAPWSDPGISCAYWTLALATAIAASVDDSSADMGAEPPTVSERSGGSQS